MRVSTAVLGDPPTHPLTTTHLQDNFYVLDLGALQRLYRAWNEAMPRVQPHYAVKCNPDVAVLSCLAALGAGFDCASEAEVRAVRRAELAAVASVVAGAPGVRAVSRIHLLLRTAAPLRLTLYSTFRLLPPPQVCSLGVSPDRIVFANPCKRPKDLRCAADRGVELTTFDTEAELAKLARFAPGSRAMLRIRADDPGEGLLG